MSFRKTIYNSYLNQTDSSTSSSTLTIAGLDINAESVSAALIRLGMDNLEIVSKAEAFLPQGVGLNDFSDNQAAFQNSCQQALKAAREGFTTDLRSIVIGLSGDLIRGITQTIEVNRPDPHSPLSEKEMDNLLLNNQTQALKQAVAGLRLENHNQDFDLRLLNSSLISFAVDDHVVDNPLNYRAAKISIQLYNVFVPSAWLIAGQKIAEHLGLNLIALAYKPFALARSLTGNQTNSDLNALLINVEDQITDVGLIQNGILAYSGNFGIGSWAFDRALIRNLKFDQADVAGLKNEQGNFNLSQLPEKRRAEAEKILSHTAYVWLQGLNSDFKGF